MLHDFMTTHIHLLDWRVRYIAVLFLASAFIYLVAFALSAMFPKELNHTDDNNNTPSD